jgi:hypothetical protein
VQTASTPQAASGPAGRSMPQDVVSLSRAAVQHVQGGDQDGDGS